jgi:hypothetical protein
MERHMTDKAGDRAPDAGSAAKRPEVGDQSRGESDTGAGQEATKGKAPEKHTHEHQSNYGGGGANGGANGGADKS